MSGGCAMGSLGSGANVSDVTYRNIYTSSSNQMYMIKSNGGDGEVKNILLENFIGERPPSPIITLAGSNIAWKVTTTPTPLIWIAPGAA